VSPVVNQFGFVCRSDVERIWRIIESQGQILALDFRLKSVQPFDFLSFRLEAGWGSCAGLLTLDPIPEPYTLSSTLYAPHPTPYTRNPTPYTLHPAPCTIHSKHYSLHPTTFTPHPTCSARKPTSGGSVLHRGDHLLGPACTPHTLHLTPSLLSFNPTPYNPHLAPSLLTFNPTPCALHLTP